MASKKAAQTKTSTKTAGARAIDLPGAIAKMLSNLAGVLDVPAIDAEIEHRTRVTTLRLRNGGVVKGTLSAPRELLSALWGDVPGFAERLWDVPGGRWDLLRTKLQCEEELQADWLAIADAVLASGDSEEAQLVWLQADDFANTNRKSARFKSLFPTLPAVAKIDVARSAAAFVERVLPLAGEGSVVDRFLAAQAALDNILEARSDADGLRRTKLLASYDAAIGTLEAHAAPALREMARLMRGMRANCA